MHIKLNGHSSTCQFTWILLVTVFGLAACIDDKPKAKKSAAPSVVVAPGTSEAVPVERQCMGTTAAVKQVEIRARVQG